MKKEIEGVTYDTDKALLIRSVELSIGKFELYVHPENHHGRPQPFVVVTSLESYTVDAEYCGSELKLMDWEDSTRFIAAVDYFARLK